jgi:hypothetical protein
MRERFILPEKWCCLARNSDEDKVLTDYVVDVFGVECDYDVTCKGNCWFTNFRIIGDHYYQFNDKPSNCTEITYDQFIKYVLNKEVDDVTLQESEDLSYLIEFLTLKGIK